MLLPVNSLVNSSTECATNANGQNCSMCSPPSLMHPKSTFPIDLTVQHCSVSGHTPSPPLNFSPTLSLKVEPPFDYINPRLNSSERTMNFDSTPVNANSAYDFHKLPLFSNGLFPQQHYFYPNVKQTRLEQTPYRQGSNNCTSLNCGFNYAVAYPSSNPAYESYSCKPTATNPAISCVLNSTDNVETGGLTHREAGEDMVPNRRAKEKKCNNRNATMTQEIVHQLLLNHWQGKFAKFTSPQQKATSAFWYY
ncbi:DNA polymerase II large subunit [Trichinella spiralis]|uniref:DNA polymerase II large subunit n=1 Tax=Trichinella spiralis TaxID=6334 RepID=A0ABR3KKS3_TRISP